MNKHMTMMMMMMMSDWWLHVAGICISVVMYSCLKQNITHVIDVRTKYNNVQFTCTILFVHLTATMLHNQIKCMQKMSCQSVSSSNQNLTAFQLGHLMW